MDKNSGFYKKRILVAEDDASMRRFLKISLERAGYEIVCAEDGLSAMKIALGEQFDAVVTDAVMPNLTGYDLCRMLRQNANSKTCLLIMLSGLAQEIAAKHEHGCVDVYLIKDENLKNELVKTLSKLFEKPDDKI